VVPGVGDVRDGGGIFWSELVRSVARVVVYFAGHDCSGDGTDIEERHGGGGGGYWGERVVAAVGEASAGGDYGSERGGTDARREIGAAGAVGLGAQRRAI
jgi:hypothetical protein